MIPLKDRVFSVRVLKTTQVGVQCELLGGSEPFWLSRSNCRWSEDPQGSLFVEVAVPEWLANKHRQLVGDREFERAKIENQRGSKLNTKQADGHGVLFRNQYKTKDSQPAYRGEATFNGQPIEIAAWLKTDKNGAKFFSMNLKEPQPKEDANAPLNDVVPF